MRIATLFLFACFFASCNFFGERVSGNGHIITKSVSTGAFNNVDVRGSMNVVLKQDSTVSVKVESDENLIPYIDIYTDGSTLIVRTKDNYNLDPTKDIVISVSAPVFRNLDVSGSGDLISESSITSSDEMKMHISGSGSVKMDVNAPKITAGISGSGGVMLKGAAKDLSVSMSGSGSIKCFDLAADNVSIHLSGSADAEVTANQKLDVDVSGSGSVVYKGNAAANTRISGSGSVKKVS